MMNTKFRKGISLSTDTPKRLLGVKRIIKVRISFQTDNKCLRQENSGPKSFLLTTPIALLWIEFFLFRVKCLPCLAKFDPSEKFQI